MEKIEETIEFLKVLEEEIKKLKDVIQQLLEENQQLKKNVPHHRGSKRQSIALERKEEFEKQFAEQEDLWRK